MASKPYLRGKIYWITYRKSGKTYNQSLKTTDLATAKYRVSQIELKLSEGRNILPQKINALNKLGEYYESLKNKRTERHAYDQRLKIRQFMQSENINFLSQIDSPRVESYLTKRKQSGKEKATLRADLVAVKGFINWCYRNNLLPVNPISTVKGPSIEKKSPSFLSTEQVKKLLSVTHGDLYTMIIISLYTGIRRSELLRLKWEDFDWKNARLTVPVAKSGKFRVIPFNPKLKSLVSPNNTPKSGNVFKYKNILRSPYAKALKEAGITLPRNERWHILRHTYASHLIMSGAPLVTVSNLLGHASIQTTMIYTHLSDKHLEEAGRSLTF